MSKKEIFSVFKYAAAFIAWVAGSGFATGQEILQFFGSYSYNSIAVLIIDIVGFFVVGMILLTKGYDHRDISDFNHYEYYCGKVIGKIYATIIPIMLVLTIGVLISAAGATLNQYFSINRYLGASVTAVLALLVYFVGFERLVNVVSSASPVVIIFVVFVGGFTVCRDYSAFGTIGNYTAQLAEFQTSPHWLISAVLYVSLNLLCGSTFYTALGKSAVSRRAAKLGAGLGAVVLVATIAIMNFAILLNAGDALQVSVPTLFLAEKISGVLGVVFSFVLILGIFSSCSTMLWSFCSGFFKNDKTKNRLFSAGTIIVCMFLGFVPFGKLVSIIYPIIGYCGLFFIGAVLYKGIKTRHKKEENEKVEVKTAE